MDKFLITNKILKESREISDFLSSARESGASKIYLRDKNLSKDILLKYIESRGNIEIFINFIDDLADLGANIHLKSDEINLASDLKNRKISCSAHNMDDILNAYDLNIDIIMVSPVFFVENKNPPLGLEFIKNIPDFIKPRIYALGGINRDNVSNFESMGIAGVAGIRMFEKE